MKKGKRGREEKMGKKKGKREKGRKGEGRRKTTPKNIFSFFPGYSTSFCLSEQVTNISLCICMSISAQLMQMQTPYESALAQGLPKHSFLLRNYASCWKFPTSVQSPAFLTPV